MAVYFGGRFYTENEKGKARAKAKVVAEQQQKAKAEQDRVEAQNRAAAESQRKAKEEQDRRAAAERQRRADELTALRAQANEFRIWTDANGRQATAVYAGSSDEYVDFRDQNGNLKRLRKSSLSGADSDLVRRLEEIPEIKAAKERNQARIRDAEERRRAAEEQQRQAARLVAMRKDAGVVADAYVRGLVDSGSLQSAALVGYQRGLGVPLIALYRCSFVSQGGFHRTTLCAVALADNEQGDWSVWNFDSDASVFGGLPLCSNWRQVFR